MIPRPSLAPALALLGALALTGCGSARFATDYADVVDAETARGWTVTEVDVTVPRTLTVSEENSYAPEADIVWRGEPRGDRYAQVDRIITEAAEAGARALTGPRPVRLEIDVLRFHALTERARYTLNNAGVHDILFTAQVVDAGTGQPLTPPDRVQADLIAYSGKDALEAEARGETQRVRIVAHVTEVIAGWLGAGPDPRGSFTRLGR
ncbi:hypothetical protein Ga0609869_002556 [Rhodovulum iodosum]|uniref:DUF3313 domain-containing protein n=1 Tax=Rhodovulum iodosum TaxID=68291 RepID=A0ABV3XVY1_9RHOB|nr:DUF6778 family protein [Rhodovulum robiginosum]RSK33611.1 hypothetical protein EJA01_10010 [Rhodovulum robiginosum]